MRPSQVEIRMRPWLAILGVCILSSQVVAQDDNFVSIMDVCSQESILLERTAIHQVDVLEPRDGVGNACVDVVTSSFVRLTSDDDDLLQLILFQVPSPQWFDETLDR